MVLASGPVFERTLVKNGAVVTHAEKMPCWEADHTGLGILAILVCPWIVVGCAIDAQFDVWLGLHKHMHYMPDD